MEFPIKCKRNHVVLINVTVWVALFVFEYAISRGGGATPRPPG